ncbi:glycoside hydrolase family 20 protein [Basidiobolus meristosporus CBS 931.73]|uniref:Beta-hexosaminidase n=1 Tax=Basidiobolus meristosporus CBS 931.73 TaxID=1314790 RepID=A0A1Y1XU84_9FUNG|nr:glycoside hydrolase family 20 protein [Basidiobolus meristosporus CBS 931.73]|eukprot:ORX89327.1 glycoside hydrolase family 20 protein [Basidiobolus meristosporus CBS 931.73]
MKANDPQSFLRASTWSQRPRSTNLDTINIEVESNDPRYDLQTDESYTLELKESSQAGALKAKTIFGALRGLETFSQLVSYSGKEDQLYINQYPVTIRDKPAFKYRGILLDTSRNFFAIEDLQRTIDAMSYNKMNVLHWHIIDSHSFPVLTKKTSELALKGAYGPDMMYDETQIRGLVQYGLERGVIIIPEFDIPGHAYSWGLSHPELTVCMDYNRWDVHAAEPVSGQLDITKPQTDQLVKTFLDEVVPWFDSKYTHVGGDEVRFECWNSSESIRSYMQAKGYTDYNQILLPFLEKLHGWVRESKKIPITWQEAVTHHNLTVPKDTLIEVWLGAEYTKKVASQGYPVLASSSDYWYLDCGHGDFVGGNAESVSWCDPFKTWQRVYSYDILANLTSAEAKNVWGGEVMLWSEQADFTNLDKYLWPRSSAAAEVLWSGSKDQKGNARSLLDAQARLHEMRFRLTRRGIMAEPLQPLWCARNPGRCNTPEAMSNN